MDFDYKKLKSKLTDELYNQYKMQLETLKEKNEKNVMKDIEYNSGYLSDIVVENGIVSVTISLHVSQIDYIEKDGKCVRGNSEETNDMDYEITFISKIDEKNQTCPSCGNKLEDISSQVCPFCRNTITLTPKKWVMSKKQVISQR